MPEAEPYIDILEDEILRMSKTPRQRLEAYQELMARIDEYPAGSENFARVQAVLLRDLVALALDDVQLDDQDD